MPAVAVQVVHVDTANPPAKALSACSGHPTVVVLEQPTPGILRQLIRGGVEGIVAARSGPRAVQRAIDAVADGGRHFDPGLNGTLVKAVTPTPSIPGLTSRQCDVLVLCEQGLSTSQIANELEIAQNTVKSHVRAVMQHFGVSNRVEAVRHAKERGWL